MSLLLENPPGRSCYRRLLLFEQLFGVHFCKCVLKYTFPLISATLKPMAAPIESGPPNKITRKKMLALELRRKLSACCILTIYKMNFMFTEQIYAQMLYEIGISLSSSSNVAYSQASLLSTNALIDMLFNS